MNRPSDTMTMGPIAGAMVEVRRFEPEGRRTHQKVRAQSKYPSELARHPLRQGDVNRRVRALRQYRTDLRAAGPWPEDKGPLGNSALILGEKLLQLGCDFGGLVEVSAERLAGMVGQGVRTVYRGIRQLKSHGHLDWEHTCIPTGKLAAFGGLEVTQGPNHYSFPIPEVVRRMFELWERRKQQRAQEREAAVAAEKLEAERRREAGRAVVEAWETPGSATARAVAKMRAELATDPEPG